MIHFGKVVCTMIVLESMALRNFFRSGCMVFGSMGTWRTSICIKCPALSNPTWPLDWWNNVEKIKVTFSQKYSGKRPSFQISMVPKCLRTTSHSNIEKMSLAFHGNNLFWFSTFLDSYYKIVWRWWKFYSFVILMFSSDKPFLNFCMLTDITILGLVIPFLAFP